MNDRAGQQFGNYRLVRLLGRGGFAEVYLGEHIHIQRQVAIKILANQLGTTDLNRFLREAQTITSLKHPHIVQVLDFGIQEEIPFLVMDYASKGTLRQRHPKESRVSLDEILSYVQQIAPALQYAHDHHVIHRDVKPENMLLGSQGEILLSDFGIAVTTVTSTSQQTKTTAGTVAYMAPEQIMGKPCPASDQYALGIIVYEWLSGVQPFQGSLFEVYAQHLHAPMPSLREVNPEISREIERCIAKALSKDPGKRFERIQDFATALQERSQLAISLLASTTIQQFAPEKLSDSSTGQSGPTVLGAPSETPAPPEIDQDDPTMLKAQLDILSLANTDQDDLTVLKAQLDIPSLANAHQDDPTVLKAQLDMPSLASADQDDPTYLKTRPPTLTPPSLGQDQLTLLKESFEPIDHVTVKPALVPTTPSLLPDGAKRRGKPRPSPILVACSILLVLLVTLYVLFPTGIATAFAKLIQFSPLGAIVSPPTNTPTQHGIRQSTPKAQTTRLPTPPALLPTSPAILPTQPSSPGQRMLSSIQTLSSTVNATGQGTIPGTQASGTLTFYNDSSHTDLTFNAGSTFSNNGTGPNIQMILDTSVTLPAVTGPPTSAIVRAHVVQRGTVGNIGITAFVYDGPIDPNTNRPTWAVENDSAFSGGSDDQTYTVVLQSDIDNAAAPLKTSTTQAADTNIRRQLRSDEHLVGNPQCTSNTTSDHAVNDRASTVTVTVTTTCTATAST